MSNVAYSFDEIIERLCYSAGWITVIIAAICVIFFFITPVQAADLSKDIIPAEPTIKIIRQGTAPLQSLAATKAPTEKFKTIAVETQKLMRTGTITASTVTIQKFRYDEKTGCQVFWISATRNGQEVSVNNPIWIYGAPSDVLVSEVTDTKINEITLTIKEDPKTAIEQILKNYVDSRPIGRMTTGTKA
jgi:hypothetical protein